MCFLCGVFVVFSVAVFVCLFVCVSYVFVVVFLLQFVFGGGVLFVLYRGAWGEFFM